MSTGSPRLGATPAPDGRTSFRVWAPLRPVLRLAFTERGRGALPMLRDEQGYHTLIADAPPGTLYQLELEEGRRRPDPASRAQPRGVHGPSMVVDPAFPWTDAAWTTPPLEEHVLYELHVGTFTPEGTFDAIIPRLRALRALGITAVELMPIAQFPGNRNWGYDGVDLYAAQWSYGGLDGLRRLVNAAHSEALSIVLDVVYNHLGPEGNYLPEFGPYFNDHYRTPWGAAVNLDGAESDHAREFFIQNALHWVIDCHVDGLRLDAVHAMYDRTARPFLQELVERVRSAAAARGRRVHLIAESSDNDPRLVRPPERGGIGFDAVWNDDYHHAIRAVLTGERRGYYAPFGRATQVAKALRDRFVFAGEHCPGRRRRHGAPVPDVPHTAFIIYTQNHDQVGNRAQGDRLDVTAGLEGTRIAAGLVILSPFTPMLFMGEEFGAASPFPYFVSHTDPELVRTVREGRGAEFAGFHQGEPPDPQDPKTFESAKVDWDSRTAGPHGRTLGYYGELLRLRSAAARSCPPGEPDVVAGDDPPMLSFRTGDGPGALLIVANMGRDDAEIDVPSNGLTWAMCLNSDDPQWGGVGRSPRVEARDRSLHIAMPGRTLVVLTASSVGAGDGAAP